MAIAGVSTGSCEESAQDSGTRTRGRRTLRTGPSSVPLSTSGALSYLEAEPHSQADHAEEDARGRVEPAVCEGRVVVLQQVVAVVRRYEPAARFVRVRAQGRLVLERIVDPQSAVFDDAAVGLVRAATVTLTSSTNVRGLTGRYLAVTRVRPSSTAWPR